MLLLALIPPHGYHLLEEDQTGQWGRVSTRSSDSEADATL